MIQITRQGLAYGGADADLESLRQCFERQHYLLLKDFLGPDLISLILPFLESAKYSHAQYKGVGSELLMESNMGLDMLSFLTNGAKLSDLVQAITGCGPIGSFQGRIYKLNPNQEHNFDWHNDLRDPSRLIAMSVNLTAEIFRGGMLQIREVRSGKITGEVTNTGLGSAVLFRVSEELEHRVTGIESDTPRTSFAGWFKSGPGAYSGLGKKRADADAESSRE